MNSHFIQEDIQVANKHGKKWSTSRNIRELSLKQREAITSLSKQLKLERLTIPSVGKMWRTGNSYVLLVGTQMGTTSLDPNLAVS